MIPPTARPCIIIFVWNNPHLISSCLKLGTTLSGLGYSPLFLLPSADDVQPITDAGYSWIAMWDFISRQSLPALEELKKDVSARGEAVIFRGINVTEDTRYEAECIAQGRWSPLGCDSADLLPSQGILFLDAFDRLLTESKAVACYAWNGLVYPPKALKTVCQSKHIPVFSLERGLLPERLVIDPMGINFGGSLGGGNWDRILARQTIRDHAAAADYVNEFRRRKHSIVNTGTYLDKSTLYQKLGIAPSKRIILFPNQIDSDTNIFYYSPFYKTNADALQELVSAARQLPDAFIVVKSHPEDTMASLNGLQELLGDYGTIVTDIALFSLIEPAYVIVVRNSTVGLEGVLFGKPVIALGQSAYSGKGFTYDVNGRGEILLKLESLWGTTEPSLPPPHNFELFVSYLLTDYHFSLCESQENESQNVTFITGQLSAAGVAPSRLNMQTSQETNRDRNCLELSDRLMSYPNSKFSQLTAFRTRMPTVSIIIPTYNCRNWICDAIEASLNQTYPYCEVIVIDDGSTDGTNSIVNSRYEGKIKYIYQDNSGLSAARNRGIRESSGDYIQFLDSDDVITKNKIQVQMEVLKKTGRYAVSYSDYSSSDIDTNIECPNRYLTPKTDIPSFFAHLIGDWETRLSIPVHCFLFKSSIFKDHAIMFDESLPNHEDWDCWMQVFALNPDIVFVDQKLAIYRIKQASMCSNMALMRLGFLKSIDKYIDKYRTNHDITAILIYKRNETEACYSDITDEDLHHKTQLEGAKALQAPLASACATPPRLIAFHLPQFHAIPENDLWWGKGFTEWTNVAKAAPCFPGHYQPHMPADLGYYDLSELSAMKAQASLAREYGIHGFCFYHYWFNGKLLLETPLHQMLQSGEPDFPFCLCWANEDWTRRWDGQSGEVLMGQSYSDADDIRHMYYLASFFEDRRYIRIDGKPLLLVYRANLLPAPLKTARSWRDLARKLGIGEIYLCRVESCKEEHADPKEIGFDAAVEFQPDWTMLGPDLPDPVYGDNYVYRYGDVVKRMLQKDRAGYTRFPGVTPSWDNSARRKSNATIFIDSTPAIYEYWLAETISRATPASPGENIVFINAWNEWGEGNHLEPDQKHGRAYLEATRSALQKTMQPAAPPGLTQTESSRQPLVRASDTADSKRRCAVSIVIPVFNGLELTENCLAAIAGHTPEALFELIVVDNGSTDGTRKFLQGLPAARLTVITNEQNLGFAKACNQGALAAGGAQVLFLNNDTVPHPGWLEALLKMAESDQTIGVVGSKLLYLDSTIQHAGVVVGMRDGDPFPYHVHLCQPADSPLVNLPREYQMVTGACLMIRRELFQGVGGFDETFINGHEDLDLCLKARQAGSKVMYCPASVVTHLESRTKRLLGLENFHYQKGIDNEEARGRRRFLERWRDLLRIDGDQFPSPQAERLPATNGQGLNILFTMYGWNETGGGTIFPRAVALELARRGHTVSVFYASLKSDPSKPDYSVDRSTEDGVRLFGIYNRPAPFTDPDNPEREIHDDGILQAFHTALQESKADLVHFHNFHGLSFAMAKETRRRGIPSCYTPHNYHMIDPNLYLFNSDLSLWQGTDLVKNSEAVARNPGKIQGYRQRIETTRNLLNEWVDVTLAVSTRQKELLVQHGATAERIAVVHQANSATDRLWDNPQLSGEGNRPLHAPLRIGFIGGVMPHKGVHMMVGAAQLFHPTEAEFHVYGFVSAGYLGELQGLDQQQMVTFHGEYANDQLAPIARELDIAIVPSLWEDCAPLVLLELMALRLPVIAARIGGIPDFIREGVNGFLYQHDSLAELVGCIKRCSANPETVLEMRRSLNKPHSFDRYLGHLEEIYQTLQRREVPSIAKMQLLVELAQTTAAAPLPPVVWEGSQFVGHSLALVNRELCLQLIQDGYPLRIVPYEADEFGAEADPRFARLAERVNAPLPAPAAAHVRHQWPPDFTPPAEGHWVMIQPWEFGSLPKSWIEAMASGVDEVWVPSSYVRDCYIRSGLPADRVFTVPNGVNTELFRPEARALPLKTTKRFKFLFVGGTIQRKGIDILLQAYSAAFKSGDDVCLVIKDMGGGSFYKGRTAQELIARYQENSELPEIEYLDQFLTERELAGLYTACDCLVHPYRGEGFGLPIAEAMACGRAVIVTGYGAALDFCSNETAYLIPAREVQLPQKQVGELETVGLPWLAEPDAAALASIMWQVAEHPAEASTRGKAAALHIRQNFTWQNAAAVVKSRLQELSRQPVRRFGLGRKEAPVPAGQHQFLLAAKEAALTSIVIVSLDELDCTRECLESIGRNTAEPHEVILVDNGSTDGTLPFLREFCRQKSGFRLIENGGNPGLGAGCNIGMRQARGGRIVLLHNGAAVTPGWLGGMLDCLERQPGAAIVGPMTNEAAGSQTVKETGYRSCEELERFAGSFRLANPGRRIPVDRVAGFCMLFTRDLLESVGELDTRFGSGHLEDDFCLRAALAGFGCVIAADVFIHHGESRSFAGHGLDHAAVAANSTAWDDKWDLGRLDETVASKLITRNALTKGQRLARQGRLNEAVELLLQQGIRFSPATPEPYRVLAEVLIDAGSFQDALEVLAEMPHGEELAKSLLSGLCLSGLGRPGEAQAQAAKGARLGPECAGVLHLKGTLAAGRADAGEAEELFRSALKADPGFAPPYSALAALAWERGDQMEGLKLAETGFILSPLSITALDRFHRYATASDELPREEQRVREARWIYPEHKGLAFGLIEILIRRGCYREAMEEIERAAVHFGMDDATIDAALQVRELAGVQAPVARDSGTVSVCLIVKDEAQHLASALLSVKPLADEIVVVDTGSSDRSCDIARIFGARLFSFPWNGSFSDARNVSLSKALGDWILVIDADEVLAPPDLSRLAALIKRGAAPAGYSFTTRNYTEEITRKNWSSNAGEYPEEERGLGWTPSDKVRLFPNDSRVRFEGAVHELLETSLNGCGIPIHPCDVPVHHYGKLDAAKCAEKQERYYLLGVKKLSESGGNLEALAELARQATELKRFQEAERLWHQLLQARPETAEAYFNLGYLHLAAGDYQKAHTHALRGAELAPEMKEAAFNLAKCELYLGHTEQALAGCREMLRKWPDYPPALSLLSVSSLILGSTGDAEAVVERLRCMHFDCGDFLKEYADGLNRGDRGDLAATLERFAERIAGEAGGPRHPLQ